MIPGRMRGKMKQTNKKIQEQVKQLLQVNTPPDPEAAEKKRILKQLNYDVRNMDYCNPQSFPEKILTQVSYLSPWNWLIQAGFLTILFFFAYRGERGCVTSFTILLAPCLILILLCELIKTFSHNMWEMESACRYNLARLFLFRLCILSGSDFLVLGGALVAFQMTGGRLWQFALNALLPFFLSASLCLWVLRRFGNRVNRTALAGACLLLFILWIPLLATPEINILIYDDLASMSVSDHFTWLPKAVLLATLFALAMFLINAFRLCTKQYFETKYPCNPMFHHI